jgi:hypothetical protein
MVPSAAVRTCAVANATVINDVCRGTPSNTPSATLCETLSRTQPCPPVATKGTFSEKGAGNGDTAPDGAVSAPSQAHNGQLAPQGTT